MTTPDLRSALERIAAKVTEVIEDAESQHPGGWGPDVTTVAVLREARDDLLNHRAALAQPEPGPTADEWTTLREAFAIGAVSYDGDSWFAADAGYGYDEAEATMNAARAILARLSETPR